MQLAPVGLTMMENLRNILLLANLENPRLWHTKRFPNISSGVKLSDGFALWFNSLGVGGICKHFINITSPDKCETACDFCCSQRITIDEIINSHSCNSKQRSCFGNRHVVFVASFTRRNLVCFLLGVLLCLEKDSFSDCVFICTTVTLPWTKPCWGLPSNELLSAPFADFLILTLLAVIFVHFLLLLRWLMASTIVYSIIPLSTIVLFLYYLANLRHYNNGFFWDGSTRAVQKIDQKRFISTLLKKQAKRKGAHYERLMWYFVIDCNRC